VTGPRLEADVFLQLIVCVARRPLPISEFSRRSICSLPMHLRPTILINAGQIAGASLEVLRASKRHNSFFAVKGGGLVDVFCAKVVDYEAFADSHTIDDTTLHVHLTPLRDGLPVVDQKSRQEMSRQFQSKFLAYRCRYIQDVRHSHFDQARFTPATRVLARVLGTPIVDAPALDARLICLLQQHEQKRKKDAHFSGPICGVLLSRL